MNIEQIHEQTEKEINRKVDSFKKNVDKIEKSNNPYYQDKKVQEYEINQKREELEEEVHELMDDYNTKIDSAIAQQHRAANRSYFRTSQAQKDFVTAKIKDFSAELAFARTSREKKDIVRSLVDVLDNMGEAELSEAKRQLSEVMTNEEDEDVKKDIREINDVLGNIQTQEQADLEYLQELKANSPDAKFRRLKIIHKAFSDYPNNTKKNNPYHS